MQNPSHDITNPIWRLNNLYKVIDKAGKEVDFRPNWAQQELIETLHSRNVILKARQLGFTTLCCLMYLDDCLFRSNVRAAVIAHKLDDAKVIFRDKVKFPYDRLPEALRQRIPTVQDASDTLTFVNNSSIRVSTSTRSGTVNWLHVSEYGKICAQFPEKAREIRTGAFPSAEQGTIVLESTAEGNEGDFYEKCQTAQSLANLGQPLSRLDYRFFFFPWFKEPSYRLRQSVAPTSPEDEAYFQRIEAEARTDIDREQRHWWLKNERELGGDMKREYPATPREAFEQAIEGAYFADQLAMAEKHGRIGHYKPDPALPVYTAWDLGRNDLNAIWLFQDAGNLVNFVGYYENSGEFIGHYIDWLENWRKTHGVQFGKHYLPHDGDRDSLWLPSGTMDVMAKLAFRPQIVERTKNLVESIQMTRRRFQMCCFDADACKQGLHRLKTFRKEWNERLGVWSDRPRHDEASHGASAFRTFAESGHTPQMRSTPEVRDRYRNRQRDAAVSWMGA